MKTNPFFWGLPLCRSLFLTSCLATTTRTSKSKRGCYQKRQWSQFLGWRNAFPSLKKSFQSYTRRIVPASSLKCSTPLGQPLQSLHFFLPLTRLTSSLPICPNLPWLATTGACILFLVELAAKHAAAMVTALVRAPGLHQAWNSEQSTGLLSRVQNMGRLTSWKFKPERSVKIPSTRHVCSLFRTFAAFPTTFRPSWSTQLQ